MKSIISNKWGNIPPPSGCQLDRGNSLTNGMVGCWIFNRSAGKIIQNIANPFSDAVITTGTPSFQLGPRGYGMKMSNTASETLIINDNPILRPTTAVSVAILCNIYTVPNTNQYPCFGQNSSERKFEFLIGYNSDQPRFILYIDSTRRDFLPVPSQIAITTGYNSMVFSWSGKDGVGTFITQGRKYEADTPYTGTISHTVCNLMIGPLGGSIQSYASGDILYYMICMWNRKLLTSEGMEFLANPYSIIAPPIKKYIIIEEAPTAPNMDKWFVETSRVKLGKAEVVSY